MANEFKVRKGLIVNGSGSTILDVQGSQGQLFSVVDQLSGSLFAVNDISGIPIVEVFSDTTVKMGQYNAEAIIVSGSNARVTGSLLGTASWANNTTSASYAQTASFVNTLLQPVIISGSLTVVTDSGVEFQVTNTGVKIGNIIADTHTVTGSVSVSGSVTSNGGFVATGSYNLLANNGANLFFTNDGRLGSSGTGYHIQMSPGSNTTILAQVVTTQNGLNVTPGGNSSTYALQITSGSYPAATLLRVGSNILTVTGSNVGINKAAPNATLDIVGNTLITGSLTVVTGSGIEFQVTNTGVRIGNIITDTHVVTGSLNVSGSVTATNFTGSLLGTATTASYVLQAVSSSFATQAANASSASFATSAANATTASFANFANTASSADNFNVRNTLTVTTIVAQVITSSQDFVTGSTRFGTIITNTHQFTGSVSISGSLNVTGNGITGSLLGTATTASYVLQAVSASFATQAANSTTASFILNAVSSSFATNAANATTASYILNAASASFASTASFVNTLNQNILITGSLTVGQTTLGSGENTLVLGAPPNTAAGEGGQILLAASGGLFTSASMLDNYQNRFRVLRGTNAGSDAEIANFNMHTGLIQFNRYTGSGAFVGTVAAFLAVDSNGNILTSTGSAGGGGAAFPFTGSAQITGSLGVTGSITATSLTGSLLGTATTASYVLNAVSASFATNAANATSASYAISASYATASAFANNATSASYALTASYATASSVAISASFTTQAANASSASFATSAASATSASIATNAVTASFVLNAVSASFATNAANATTASFATFANTASSADNFNVRNTLTVQTIIAQVITSSQNFVTGSTKFGTIITNTHQFTGSVSISGSLNVVGNGITGSLLGTAATASYVLNAISSSFATSAASATSASIAANTVTASHALNAVTASFATNAANAFVQNGNSFGAAALLGTNDAQNLQFETNGTVRMTVSSSGNVGIGTTNPISRLQIGTLASTSTATPETLNLGGTFSNSAGSNVKLRVYDDGSAIGGMSVSSNQIEVNTWSLGRLAFYRGTTLSMVIDTNSNVGIGTTAPTSLLHINGTVSGSAFQAYGTGRIFSSQNVGTNSAWIEFINTGGNFYVGRDNSTGTSFGTGTAYSAVLYEGGSNPMAFFTSGSIRMFISSSGNIGIGTTAPSQRLHIHSGSAFIVGGLAANATQAYTASGRLIFNNDFTDIARGPNKVTLYDDVAWKGGLGIHLATVGYYSGQDHRFYRMLGTDVSTITHLMVVSGSGNVGINMTTPSGSTLTVNGNVWATSFTGSLLGTATTASYVLNAVSSSFATQAANSTTASFALTASTVLGSITSASYSATASVLLGSITSASYAATASVVLGSITSASFASTSSFTFQAANASSASFATSAANATTASFATFATSASYAATSSFSRDLTVGNTFVLDATLTDYASIAASSVGSNNLFTQNTSSYTSAFFKYTCASASFASRAGEVIAIWNGTSVQFTDFSTVDVGNTGPVTASVAIVTGQVQFNIQTNTSGWTIKSMATFI